MDYQTWISVTKTLTYQIGFFSILTLFLIIYLIIAGIRRIRTSDGRKLKASMLSRGSAWIPVILWIIMGIFFYFILIDPVWIKWFGS